jgi:hypothetical protein
MRLAHVTLEVPMHKIDGCVRWYEEQLGLTRIPTAIEPGHTGADAVWFREGLHLIPVSYWMSREHTMAHFCLKATPRQYEEIKARTARDRQRSDNGERFFISDPFSHHIEITK